MDKKWWFNLLRRVGLANVIASLLTLLVVKEVTLHWWVWLHSSTYMMCIGLILGVTYRDSPKDTPQVTPEEAPEISTFVHLGARASDGGVRGVFCPTCEDPSPKESLGPQLLKCNNCGESFNPRTASFVYVLKKPADLGVPESIESQINDIQGGENELH